MSSDALEWTPLALVHALGGLRTQRAHGAPKEAHSSPREARSDVRPFVQSLTRAISAAHSAIGCREERGSA
jgi:hypothetical protein